MYKKQRGQIANRCRGSTKTRITSKQRPRFHVASCLLSYDTVEIGRFRQQNSAKRYILYFFNYIFFKIFVSQLFTLYQSFF